MNYSDYDSAEIEHDGGAIPLLVLFPWGVICLGLIAQPWATESLWNYIPLMLMTSFVFLCYTSCFHETAHQTLGNSRWFSLLMGRVLGTIIFTPYTTYRESHIRHHAYLNKPADTELWPYSDPNASLWFRRAFVWMDLLFGFITNPIIYGRIFWAKNSPIKRPEIRKAIAIEYTVILIFWVSLFLLLFWNNWWLDFLTIWGLPVWVASFLQAGRKLTEHLGMRSYDPLQGTRTVVGANWFTRFCTWMNFDIFVHGPHHRHPRLGHSQLVDKIAAYRETDEMEFPVFQNYGSAVAAMIPWIFRNPGVGVNAGGHAPRTEKVTDVSQFASDVTSEIVADEDAESTRSVR